MLHGIQAGFGRILGAPVLNQLREFGYRLVRLDCQWNALPSLDRPAKAAYAKCLADEVLLAGMTPLIIIDRVEQVEWFQRKLVVLEAMNEPDLRQMSASAYGSFVVSVSLEANRLGLPLYVGSISNLNKRGFTFLRDIMPYVMGRAGVEGISIHRYAAGRSPTHPHTGYDSRLNEVEELQKLLQGMPFGVSEFGYHTCRQWTWHIWPWRHSDEQVAAHVAWEHGFWREQGATFSVLYQVNDGPAQTSEERYGIRRGDGSWKPVATVKEDKLWMVS